METTHRKEKTKFRIGTTPAQRHDSRQKANDLYHQRMNEIAGRVHRLPLARPEIRFSAYADTYARDVLAAHKGAVRELELLAMLKRGFGNDLLTSIDRERVQAWMTIRRQTVSARTVNREIDLLKSMLRDAVPKYLDASPIHEMKRLKTVKPRRRLLTYAEEKRLLAAATEPQDKALIVLGIDTLLRLGDLLDLKRTDRHGSWLYVRDPKNGEPYEVPLSPRASAALGAVRHSHEFYFEKFRRAENARDWRGAVRQRLELLCRDAEIPFGKGANGITFHWATRRTGATRLLMKRKQPVPVVQRLGNWKKPDVLLEIYAEAQRGDLAAAVGLFPKRSRPKQRTA